MGQIKVFALALFFLPILGHSADEMGDPIVVISVPASQNETSVSNPSDLNEELDVQIDPQLVQQAQANENSKSGMYLRIVQKLSQSIPQKLESLFIKAKVSQNLREFIVNDVRSKLEKAPPIIERSNASGISARGLVVAGVGISDFIYKHFKNKLPESKLAPKFLAFGLIFGAGTTVLSTQDSYGHKRTIIRFFVEGEYVNRMVSWMAEGLLGGGVT